MWKMYHHAQCFVLGVVAEWSNVLRAVPWPFMVWFTLALGTYQLRFISWVFHVIFSFVYYISFDTLGGLRAFRKPFSINYVFIQSSDCKSYINKEICKNIQAKQFWLQCRYIKHSWRVPSAGSTIRASRWQGHCVQRQTCNL